MGSNGWPFASEDEFPGADIDSLHANYKHVRDLYLSINPDYKGRFVQSSSHPLLSRITSFLRFTVPVLWDKKNETIVNNESSEIIRILNTAFDGLISGDKKTLDLYPESLHAEIDELNAWVYDTVNSMFFRPVP